MTEQNKMQKAKEWLRRKGKNLLYGTILATAALTPKTGSAAQNASSADNSDHKPQIELTIDYKKMPSASIEAELSNEEWHKLLDGVIKYSKNDHGMLIINSNDMAKVLQNSKISPEKVKTVLGAIVVKINQENIQENTPRQDTPSKQNTTNNIAEGQVKSKYGAFTYTLEDGTLKTQGSISINNSLMPQIYRIEGENFYRCGSGKSNNLNIVKNKTQMLISSTMMNKLALQDYIAKGGTLTEAQQKLLEKVDNTLEANGLGYNAQTNSFNQVDSDGLGVSFYHTVSAKEYDKIQKNNLNKLKKGGQKVNPSILRTHQNEQAR